MKQKFFLTLLLLFAATTATAYDFEVDGMYYNIISDNEAAVVRDVDYFRINGNKATVVNEVDFGGCYTGDIVIPESVTYEGVTYTVTSVGFAAFAGCDNLYSVIIPSSVTSIREHAFVDCFDLCSVTIGNSVTSIGESAFAFCSALRSITIPKSVTSFGIAVFSGCSSLLSIKVENGNPVFDSRNNCNAIIESSSNTLLFGCQNTIIPNSVTSIGEAAFEVCSQLRSMTIPNSVTSIGDWAFYDCSSLMSVTIPNSVTSIGYNAFKKSALDSVTIPNSVTSIGESAFEECRNLKSVTIGDSVTSIGDNAFIYCYDLTDVYSYITKISAVSMGFNVFTGINSHSTLHVPSGTAQAYQADNCWYRFFGTIVEMDPIVVPGDVDGDGKLTVSDVTDMIDKILDGTATVENFPAADVNGDGKINVSDITDLVDQILSSNQ